MNEPRLTEAAQEQLEQIMAQTSDVRLYRRSLAVLEWSRGRRMTEIARMLGVSRQSVANWVRAYREGADPQVLQDEPRSGRPREWSGALDEHLEQLLKSTPQELGIHRAVSWTVPLLGHQLEVEHGRGFADETIRRALHRLGYVWKRPRYMLQPDPELEKKNTAPNPDSALTSPQRPHRSR